MFQIRLSLAQVATATAGLILTAGAHAQTPVMKPLPETTTLASISPATPALTESPFGVSTFTLTIKADLLTSPALIQVSKSCVIFVPFGEKIESVAGRTGTVYGAIKGRPLMAVSEPGYHRLIMNGPGPRWHVISCFDDGKTREQMTLADFNRLLEEKATLSGLQLAGNDPNENMTLAELGTLTAYDRVLVRRPLRHEGLFTDNDFKPPVKERMSFSYRQVYLETGTCRVLNADGKVKSDAPSSEVIEAGAVYRIVSRKAPPGTDAMSLSLTLESGKGPEALVVACKHEAFDSKVLQLEAGFKFALDFMSESQLKASVTLPKPSSPLEAQQPQP